MTPEHAALARSRTYGWMAEVLLDGWSQRAVAVAKGLPWMPALGDAEALAVRHTRVFGRLVPPYEGVFLSPQASLGGAAVAGVRGLYTRMGFAHSRTDIEPDHAGLQCQALCFLYGAEADALRDGVAHERIVSLRHTFVEQHLGRWVGSLAVAVSRQGVAEVTALTSVLAELVGDQAKPIQTEALLEDPATGLKDVARFLLVPARCGVWFSVQDIQRIAEAAGLACGFGRRVQMMESLWFSAVDHQRVPELVDAFRRELQAWQGRPGVAHTTDVLGRLREAVPLNPSAATD